MPFRKLKPTSPGTRFQTVPIFDEITTQEPYKPLVEPLKSTGGRNNQGHLTSWWRGGGHKRMYRIIDFKRDKLDIPAKVTTVEYDPNRSARIALLTYADGEKRYILHCVGLKVGDTIVAGQNVDILPGNCLPLKNIPLGTQLHNVELRPGRGGQIARSAGSTVQLVAKEGEYASVKMPSGEIRKINMECFATIGQVGNIDHENVSSGLADRHVLVVDVADLADRGEALHVDLANLARRHLHRRVLAFFRDELHRGAGAARDLAALARLQLHVVEQRAERDVLERQRIPRQDVHVLPGDDRVAHLQADRV